MILAGLSLFLFGSIGYTEQVGVSKEVQGKLMGMVAYVGKESISIETSSNEKESNEALLRLSDDIRFHGYKKYTDVKRGDRVEVVFNQKSHKDEKGEEVIEDKRVESIKLIRTGTAGRGTMTSNEQN